MSPFISRQILLAGLGLSMPVASVFDSLVEARIGAYQPSTVLLPHLEAWCGKFAGPFRDWRRTKKLYVEMKRKSSDEDQALR